MSKIKVPKFVIIIVAIAVLIGCLSIIANIKKAKKASQAITTTESTSKNKVKDELERESAFKTGNIGTQYRGKDNDAVQMESTKYTPVLEKLKECEVVDTNDETITISLSNGVSPAVIASNLEEYRKKGIVGIPNGVVVNFVDRGLYGQTLANVKVEDTDTDHKNSQNIFFACIDPIELDKQLETNSKISIIASSLDMMVMDVHSEGKTYPNALVIFGNYSPVKAPIKTTVEPKPTVEPKRNTK